MKGISGNPVLDAYQRMAISAVRGAAPAQGPAPVAPSQGGADNAEVQISAKARDLAAAGGAAIDTAKVNQLKAKIEAGDFHVDSHLVADKLLERAC